MIDEFRKNKIRTIIKNYRIYPPYIIKYIITYYSKYTSDIIIEYIVNTKENDCDIMNYILLSLPIKICNINNINSICNNECICYSRSILIYLYNKLLDLLKINSNYFLSSNNVYNSFTTLILKTDVININLFIFIRDIFKDTTKWFYIIKFIKNAELYSSEYGDIIFMMKDIILKKDNDNLDNCREDLRDVLNKYNYMQQNMSKIINNLYITDINGANNVAIIKEKKIEYIISLTKKPLFKINGIEYIQIMIDDIGTTDFIGLTLETVKKVIEYIDNNNIVLIHCYKGLSRSVCFVILVLICKGFSFNNAYNLVKNKRLKINPNPDFLHQIENFKL